MVYIVKIIHIDQYVGNFPMLIPIGRAPGLEPPGPHCSGHLFAASGTEQLASRHNSIPRAEMLDIRFSMNFYIHEFKYQII